jgi:hypothetical protein
MLGNFGGWLLCSLAILFVWIYLLFRRGPAEAVAAAIVLSFAAPVWLKLDIGDTPINVRTGIACVTMLGYLVHPRGRILSPLTVLDCCIGLCCLVHIASDSFAVGFSWDLPFRSYGEWALPYVAGRYAIKDRNDLQWIAQWAVGLLLILGIMSCIEAATSVNPYETLFGNRPEEMFRRSEKRFGLKRAFGPTMHPIFLGMLLAILVPWLTTKWQSNRSQGSRTVIGLAGVITLVGTVLTGSRTPVVTILAASILLIGLQFRALRWPIGLTLVSGFCLFAAFPDEVTMKVSEWTGGKEKPRVMEIDGKPVISSSSRYRLHVFSIYKEEMAKAGPFGYGTQATSGFPLKIPNMEGELKSANLFKMVDNGYILLTLRFGWIGGVCLAILFLTAIVTGFSLYSSEPDQLFPGAVACTLIVVACFSLLLIFMHYDFGFPLLWTFGILSGLASLRTSERS